MYAADDKTEHRPLPVVEHQPVIIIATERGLVSGTMACVVAVVQNPMMTISMCARL
jgi:hypothetical protein